MGSKLDFDEISIFSIFYLRGLTADAAALRDRERMESRKVHDENPIGARMVKGVEPEMHPNGAPGKLARLRVWSQNGAPGKFARLMVWSQRCTRMVHFVNRGWLRVWSQRCTRMVLLVSLHG